MILLCNKFSRGTCCLLIFIRFSGCKTNARVCIEEINCFTVVVESNYGYNKYFFTTGCDIFNTKEAATNCSPFYHS